MLVAAGMVGWPNRVTYVIGSFIAIKKSCYHILGRHFMIRYTTTIFLSAFLLFQIQPLIAKAILPWFGGTAAVWTTCMMFFQLVLLLGYVYSHLLRYTFAPKTAWMIHSLLLGAAACFANILPADTLQPDGDENPTFAILKLLLLTIGLPFFTLSTTGPLVQAWQSTSHPQHSPYRLYALSNLGSMLALLSFPFLIERYFSLDTQVSFWRISFLMFCGLCCWSGWQTVRSPRWAGGIDPSLVSSHLVMGEPNTRKQWEFGGVLIPTIWVLLAMAASVMCLATTNLMCQEVASIPLLWILPLSLYLLSFIICFDRPAWYRRRIFTPLLAISSIVALLVLHLNVYAGLSLQIGALAAVCFSASMTCHGELERLKPSPQRLTWFYLMVAVGGSLGGVFVTVVAPHLFVGFFEFQIGLLVCLSIPLAVIFFDRRPTSDPAYDPPGQALLIVPVLLAATLVVCSLVMFLGPDFPPGIVFQARNEYGLVSVVKKGDYLRFINGRIEHGGQHLGPNANLAHGSYYQPGSGVAVAIECFRNYLESSAGGRGLRIGVLGLGAGSMMTWGQPSDSFVFYEINPEVERIARQYFSFLKDSLARSEVVLGDGRLQLDRRAKKLQTQIESAIGNADTIQQSNSRLEKFDLLFLDAFSSDSIPIHLMTSEAFFVYTRNLKSDGILIAHITNRFVDLRPVIYQLAVDKGLTPILLDCKSPDGSFETRWVLMTSNPAIIHSTIVQQFRTPWPSDMRPVHWTDDHTSVADVIDWSGAVDWQALNELKKSK